MNKHQDVFVREVLPKASIGPTSSISLSWNFMRLACTQKKIRAGICIGVPDEPALVGFTPLHGKLMRLPIVIVKHYYVTYIQVNKAI